VSVVSFDATTICPSGSLVLSVNGHRLAPALALAVMPVLEQNDLFTFDVQDSHNDTYTVTFTPIQACTMVIEVCRDGEAVKGSPFPARADVNPSTKKIEVTLDKAAFNGPPPRGSKKAPRANISINLVGISRMTTKCVRTGLNKVSIIITPVSDSAFSMELRSNGAQLPASPFRFSRGGNKLQSEGNSSVPSSPAIDKPTRLDTAAAGSSSNRLASTPAKSPITPSATRLPALARSSSTSSATGTKAASPAVTATRSPSISRTSSAAAAAAAATKPTPINTAK